MQWVRERVEELTVERKAEVRSSKTQQAIIRKENFVPSLVGSFWSFGAAKWRI